MKKSILFILSIFTFQCNKIEIKQNQKFSFQKELTVDSILRTYKLVLPPNYYNSTSSPLVIALHGGGGSANQAELSYGLLEKAASEQYAIVFADGVKSEGVLGIRTWNAGTCCEYAANKNIDDVNFIKTIIKELVKEYKIDPKRIYLTGMSNGSMMSYRYASEFSETVAAIATVAGPQSLTTEFKPKSQVPIMHFHSMLDQRVPYLGGTGIAGNTFPPVLSGLNNWAKINGCETTPKLVFEDNNYIKYEWKNCKKSIVYYLTKDGGHSWPGADKVRSGGDNPSTAINANDLMFEFFKKNSLN